MSDEKQFSPKEIEDLLAQIKYPGFSRDIVSFGIVDQIIVDGSQVTINLIFSTNNEEISKQVSDDIVKLLSSNGIQEIDINSKHQSPEEAKEEKKEEENPVPGVKCVIAVASGKGGVGKSTVAANLAIALQRSGLEVGLLDADIHGPSVPTLLGLKSEPEPVPGENMIKPMEAYGIKAMSMGVLVDSNTPLVWRGPMVSSAVTQLMKDVKWGELDVLVLDMPPGTGDIQLTVAQKVNLAGAVIVTTPQDLAVIDARKGIAMFKTVNVPVLGIVENMSYFLCPHCGERSEIFSNGGAGKEAERHHVPLLGEIPLVPEIRAGGDNGKPVALGDDKVAEVFKSIAETVWAKVNQDK